MLTCFICKEKINDPPAFFDHLKKSHKLKDISTFQCTFGQCRSIFTNFSSYKKHVTGCVKKEAIVENDPESDGELDNEALIYSVDNDVLEFQKGVNCAALDLACSFCANMKTPRCEIYENIDIIKKIYINYIISGMQKVVVARVRPEEEEAIHHFIKAIESSFDDIETECKLFHALSDLDLIAPIEKCEVFESVDQVKENSKKKPRRKNKEKTVTSGPVLQVDGRKRNRELVEREEDSEVEDDTVELETSNGIVLKGIVTLMPIEFQFRKFFELPNVFEKVKQNIIKLQEGNDLDHFMKGKLWKEKIKNYEPGTVVLPFHFYGDGVQINNPLGPHAKEGEQQMYYLSLPCLPYEFHSRLDNILVAQSYPASYHGKFSSEKLFNNIVEKFESLAVNGVTLNINGEKSEVKFVCGCYIADNKEQNSRLSYVGSFSGSHCCRFCRMHINEIRTNTDSAGAVRRNRENYDEDVAADDVTATGVHEDSVFNKIPYFHVTESSAPNLAHDLTEGTLHTTLARSLLGFFEKKYFDLEFLNDRMVSMDFGEAEKGNLPVPITMDKLKTFKFKMTSSEMFFFMHHLTLMIGHRVPEDDPVWQHVLTTIKFFDLSYLPKYTEDDKTALRIENKKFNQGLIDNFNISLQHKPS